MKRVATHFLSDKAKITLFSKLSNFYFDLRPGHPRARQRSENPTPGATGIFESLGVARGGEDGQAWN